MSDIKGKELVRRLAWMVHQDEELFAVQLESAVSMLFIYSRSLSRMFFFGLQKLHSREPSQLYAIFFIQGFSKTNFTTTEAACVILACEMRTGLNFNLEQIQSGVLKDHLMPEDYDLEKRVSLLYPSFTLFFRYLR